MSPKLHIILIHVYIGSDHPFLVTCGVISARPTSQHNGRRLHPLPKKNIYMLSTTVISCAYIVRHFPAQSHNLNSDLAFPSDSLACIYGVQFVAAEWFDGSY